MPTEFTEGERWEARMTITPDVGAPTAPSRTVVKSEGGLRFQNHRGNVYALNVPYETSPFFNTKSLNAWRQWPLEAGKTWAFEGEFSPSGGTARLRQTATVVGFEEVSVPAGTFKALKITYVEPPQPEAKPGLATKPTGTRPTSGRTSRRRSRRLPIRVLST